MLERDSVLGADEGEQALDFHPAQIVVVVIVELRDQDALHLGELGGQLNLLIIDRHDTFHGQRLGLGADIAAPASNIALTAAARFL